MALRERVGFPMAHADCPDHFVLPPHRHRQGAADAAAAPARTRCGRHFGCGLDIVQIAHAACRVRPEHITRTCVHWELATKFFELLGREIVMSDHIDGVALEAPDYTPERPA